MLKNTTKENKKKLVKQMISRMAIAYGVKRKDLHTIFDCKKNDLNNWVYNASIPLEELDQCRQETGYPMDWLIYGPSPVAKTELTQKLTTITSKLFADAIDFEMIEEIYDGSINQLIKKFETEIENLIRSTDRQNITGTRQ
jgi:hypothetical protein